MKYVIWTSVFLAYVLVFVGIFTLLNNITRGIDVEIDVSREVYGEIKVRKQTVGFNEVPIVKWIFGMTGLLITVCGGYTAAYSLSAAWGNENERKMTKIEQGIWAGSLLVFFTFFSFIFKVHTIFEFFSSIGLMFMAATCIGAYAVSTALCKYLDSRGKAVKPQETGE
jgi:hypothetical protein